MKKKMVMALKEIKGLFVRDPQAVYMAGWPWQLRAASLILHLVAGCVFIALALVAMVPFAALYWTGVALGLVRRDELSTR